MTLNDNHLCFLEYLAVSNNRRTTQNIFLFTVELWTEDDVRSLLTHHLKDLP